MTDSSNLASLSKEVIQFIESQTTLVVSRASRITGGCINQTFRVQMTDGKSLFVKTNSAAIVDNISMFVAEATALEQMAKYVKESVPSVVAFSEKILVLEFISEQSKDSAFWQRLAIQLAKLHHNSYESFGFICDNFCGATLQPNPCIENGHDFFAEHRLLYQAKLAFDKGLLEPAEVAMLERLCVRLPVLIPNMPAVLIHGDLWSGNCINSKDGPKFVDPACYYGWAEAEIAMTRLFGGFPESFYRDYHALYPPECGWQDRVGIYNMYHLLNHLNLFGQSYLSAVQQSLKRYH